MARIATKIETILSAAKTRLVTKGVVNDGYAFVVDGPDDMVSAGGLLANEAAAVWWRLVEQSPRDVSTDVDADEIPIASGDLMVSLYVRIAVDQAGRADYAGENQSAGANIVVRRAVNALNDYMLASGASDLLMETLTFRRVVNRGKVRGQEKWRQYDLAFDLMFSWELAVPDIGPVVGAGSRAIGAGTVAVGAVL